MTRLSGLSLGSLVVATVGAFFVTQHLKVATPLIAGASTPRPATIDPRTGARCGGLSHRTTTISFYLLHRPDDVDVYVVDQSGAIVRTVASSRHMRRGVRKPDGVFSWDGREDSGRLAPDGTYHFRIALIHQGRTVDLSTKPVVVKTVPPHPVVNRVSPSVIPQGRQPATIRYSGNEDRGGTVRIYTDLAGKPVLVKSFLTSWRGNTARWDGRIRRRPAPAGIYLVGLDVTDAACNTGRFPASLPPAPGSTRGAGLTVRYLAALPPLDPVSGGSTARVFVDSRQRPYRWALRRAGASKVLAFGRSSRSELPVALPNGAALYRLSMRSGAHATSVPLVASGSRHARVLVVLPSLTWQGENPSDEDQDGVPATLEVGGSIRLNRLLAAGLPAGIGDEAALLSYLDRSHREYDLTTDLGLIDGVGPALAGHTAVVLAGSERWLPASLSEALRSYVQGGGNVLSMGIDSLRRGVTVRAGRAFAPTAAATTDVLGARPAGLVTDNSDPLVVIRDGLGIFSSTSGSFRGFRSYQPIPSVAPPAQILSEAGTGATAPSILGYRLGRGTVVDIAVAGFASRLPQDHDAQQFLGRVWTVLGG